jgi:hypothetical protein
MEVEVAVGDLNRLSRGREMEASILEMTRTSMPDDEIACVLTDGGHRLPMRDYVLVSTVRAVRLREKILRNRNQSHPRNIPGWLTVSQMEDQLQLSRHWIYDRIHDGTIAIRRDETTGLYLFLRNPHHGRGGISLLKDVAQRLGPPLEIDEDALLVALLVVGGAGIGIVHPVTQGVVEEHRDLAGRGGHGLADPC